MIAARFAIAFTLVALAGVPAFAQSGATGGTLGKSGKSVSGAAVVKKAPAKAGATPKATERRESDPCRTALGTWSWTNLGSTTTVVFDTAGKATATNGYRGNWTCDSGVYSVTWHTGVSESFSISGNGSKLTGNNFIGGPISGARQ